MIEIDGGQWHLYSLPEHDPEVYEMDRGRLFLFGWASAGRGSTVRTTVEEAGNLAEAAQALDGEFVLIEASAEEVRVVSDRLGSVPFFYAHLEDEVILSRDYLALWRTLRERQELYLNPGAFYEFFTMQRLFGRRTYDRKSKALEGASILAYDARADDVTTDRYWRPDPNKVQRSREDWASDLADRLREVVRSRVRPDQSYGLLLSGGLDSRAVLGAFPDPKSLTCYTLGSSFNNEVKVAEELATTAGSKHVFLERNSSYYADCIEQAVRLGGGMYTFDHAHFLAASELITEDILLHGHGLDYLFQGMYLPTWRPSIRGHQTYFEYLRGLDTPVPEAYMKEVSYRLTDDTPDTAVARERRPRYQHQVRESLESMLCTVEEFSSPYDRWEYLHTDTQFRHYTHLNVLSILNQVQQKTVAFAPALLELYWSTPARARVGRRLVERAIEELAPELLTTRDANTNLPIGESPLKTTARATWHALSRRVPGIPVRHHYPSAEDQSWPDRDKMVRRLPPIRQRARQLSESNRLARIGVFDLDVIDKTVKAHLGGEIGAGVGILSLITIDEFLRQGGLPK